VDALDARAVGVHDGVLHVRQDRLVVAGVGVVLPVPEARRPLLRYVWNDLTSEEEVRVHPKILNARRIQDLESQVLGGRTSK
jgi:hypothetical protein